MLSIVINLLLAVYILVSLLIILLVLMQRPKTEGLGAAFGGGMTENLFGAQTTNVLQTITRWCGVIFFVLSIGLSWLYVQRAVQKNKSSIQKQLLSVPAAVTPAPADADMKQVQEAIQKALEEKKGDAKPADGTTVPPEVASPPVKPTDPAPVPVPDAKPAPAADKPAPPEKAPESPPK